MGVLGEAENDYVWRRLTVCLEKKKGVSVKGKKMCLERVILGVFGSELGEGEKWCVQTGKGCAWL